MPEIPALLWFGIAGLLLALFVRVLKQNFRRRVRFDFIQFLQQRYPQFTVVAEKEHYLMLRRDGADEQIFMHKLYAGIAASRARAPRERDKIFRHFIEALLEHQELTKRPLELSRDGDRIMPRLAPAAFVSGVSRTLKEELPHTRVSALGLAVVYVFDAPESVVYLTAKHLGQLGLDLSALHQRALDNLEKKFPEDFVRRAVQNKALNVLKSQDTYDAARLLLVPKFLKEGEALAAAIPDRDTLVLCPVPKDDNWTSMLKLARTPSGDVLLAQPVKVSAGGFELI